MKNLLPALLLLVCLTACQKEVVNTLSGNTPGNTDTPAVSGSITAKIDGMPWTADKVAYAHFGVAANGVPPLISIIGIGNDKKILGFSVVDSGVHQYTFMGQNSGNYNAGFFQDSSLPDVNTFVSVAAPTQPSGTVIVQAIDRNKKTISGTFSYTAYRDVDGQQRTITDGVFTEIPYIEGSGLPSSSLEDTFTVKIDGTPFVPYSITGLSVALTNSIAVQGSDQQGIKNVGLTFPMDITPGTYTLDIFEGTYMALYNTGTGTLASLSGTLQILEHNPTTKRVRGTFSFKGEDASQALEPAQLTEGYFSVTYQ